MSPGREHGRHVHRLCFTLRGSCSPTCCCLRIAVPSAREFDPLSVRVGALCRPLGYGRCYVEALTSSNPPQA
eukprot:658109-Heterocapsa_arctica.AAC.1